jgi:hypothetical protein
VVRLVKHERGEDFHRRISAIPKARRSVRSEDYMKGYNSGYVAGRRRGEHCRTIRRG